MNVANLAEAVANFINYFVQFDGQRELAGIMVSRHTGMMATRSAQLVDTRRCVRRSVVYDSPYDVLADAERLAAAGAATMGNWSLAEIIDHLATAIDLMIDGFGFAAPWYVRVAGRAFFKRRFLERGIPPRLPFPSGGAVRPFRAGVDVEEALAHLREATERMTRTQEFAPHPVFGRMPREDVLRLHLRHAELHMGFVCEGAGHVESP